MKRNQVALVCENCKTPFDVQYHRKDIARFCSRSCYSEWRKGKTFYDTISTNEIANRYMSGDSAPSLADEYGVSVSAICYHLNKADVERRSPSISDDAREKARQANRKRRGRNHYRYIELPDEEIKSLYQDGTSLEVIADKYDTSVATIARRLRSAKVQLRRSGFSRRRKCPDGHIVDSSWEYWVDRWLADNDIDHEVHPIVPWWNGGKSPMRADFRVGETYIEVWGVINNGKYNSKRRKKVTKFKELGIELIEVFPHHVLDGDYSILQSLLVR